ncbi:hypothetical protein HOF56_00245 [Candidatus Peribacteria bacterium]|jgi:hypothetical protein|nr:hypothetical protein [Candidatus Peribacteria bacterium]MBT4020954.1 hypothetical protein [Candidatus Peribacteria bacterium]MBT4240304.1 hypothetical protein [Candidatus Peribacteria bacterium]MBT4474098.1 hypothetical protein [Candidatus Peribacteria bacterium]
MPPTNLPLIILIIITLFFLISIPAFKIKREEFKKTGKHPKGHYMGLGIATGLPIGIPLGAVMGNIALGPAIGIAIGVVIGAGLEKQHASELRPMTERERSVQQKLILICTGTLLLGVLTFFYLQNF